MVGPVVALTTVPAALTPGGVLAAVLFHAVGNLAAELVTSAGADVLVLAATAAVAGLLVLLVLVLVVLLLLLLLLLAAAWPRMRRSAPAPQTRERVG